MTQHRPDRRARTVALLGLIFQLLLSAFYIVLTVWSGSEAMRGLTLLTSVGTLIWVFLVLIYHQRVLVQEEAFESEQLRKERAAGGGAIFDVDDEQLLLARRRLRWMYRWVLPGFTVLIIVLLVAAALFRWPWTLGVGVRTESWKTIENTGLLTWFVGGTAFLAFLFSRYATGMARQAEWRMLRAGASFLMGVTLGAVALTATLAAVHFAVSPVPERVLAYVLRILLLVLAAEFTLNFVLDFYRPRSVDEEPRPAFDSRLLGLFSEPGGIARSIADAINYQFGFEVSSTWFYKLLQRSVVPLLGFAVAAMLAISSLVFIEANEEGIVERYGRPLPEVLQPGLHVKYPWPIDVVRKVATSTIHELKIGIKPEAQPEEQRPDREELILWTNKHSQEPHLEVIVATPKLESFVRSLATTTSPAGTAATTQPSIRPAEAVAVSILRVAVSLQYHIRDAKRWIETYSDPEAMLRSLADREIMRYSASVDVGGLLGSQRTALEKQLWKTIQESADRAGLDVEIVFFGLQGVHPPEPTAESFQDVVGAEQKMTAAIRAAEAEAKKRLSEVAGDETRAKSLADAIRTQNALVTRAGATQEEREAAKVKVEQALRGIGGRAAEAITKARARRWELENAAHAQALAFRQEMVAKNMAPAAYRLRKVLEAVTQSLGNVRKYIVPGGSGADAPTLQLNLQDPMAAPFDTGLKENQ